MRCADGFGCRKGAGIVHESGVGRSAAQRPDASVGCRRPPEPSPAARPPRGASLPASPLRRFASAWAPALARAGRRSLPAAVLLTLPAALLPFAGPAAAQEVVEVPRAYPLKPSAVNPGDSFRLLFVTSRTRNASSTNIADYNSFVQDRAAAGHATIANELRIPRVVLVGGAKQLDAVDADKPFAQLQAAGMKTATMDEIMRQRDPALKEAVEASLKGEIGRAFEKLGANVAEVKANNIAGAVAARWLRLSPEVRERTGVMAPSHELRQAINGHIRERLAREGRIHGPSIETERLVSKGYTNAEKALAGNYAKGDVVAFHRPYKRLGVEKGDERRVVGVDHKAGAVRLEGKDGGTVAWNPAEIGGRKGGSEVYRSEGIELRAGDRIRWTRNDDGLGLVNSRTAAVAAVRNGRVTFQLEDGRKLELGRGDGPRPSPDFCSELHRNRKWQGECRLETNERGHARNGTVPAPIHKGLVRVRE